MALVSYEGSDDEFSDSEEEQNEPALTAPLTHAKRSLPPERQGKEKVRKIELPKLNEFDTDENNEKPKSGPAKTSSGGLFSILPAPKSAGLKKQPEGQTPKLDLPPARQQLPVPNLTPKVDNFPKPAKKSSSFLLPSSVMRKPTQSSKATFSFDTGMPQSSLRSKKTAVKEQELEAPSSTAAEVKEDTIDETNTDGVSSSNFFFSASDVEMQDGETAEDANAKPDGQEEDTNQDQPLQFATKLASWGQNAPVYASYSYDDAMEVDGSSAANDNELVASELLADEQFRRIQGKKNRELEDINIIDVRQDDQINDVDLLKNLSEETTTVSYSKKNKDLPSGQQKRKHQITYLAHRAKEQELELKNQWSNNRMTKKQTQAKYGF